MRFSLIVIFAASLVSASAVFKRQTSIPAYINTTAACVAKSCSAEDESSAESAGEALCKAAGIDPKNPFPSCTETCLKNANPGSCSLDDYSCLCRNMEYLQAADICVHSTCDAQDVAATEPAAQAVCRAVGVDITANAGAHPSDSITSASATGNATPTTKALGSTSPISAPVTNPSTTTNAAAAGLTIDKGLV
ncbi:hypothetical protein FS837_007768, partial [Tulasnella sp. UAMH 9824]